MGQSFLELERIQSWLPESLFAPKRTKITKDMLNVSLHSWRTLFIYRVWFGREPAGCLPLNSSLIYNFSKVFFLFKMKYSSQSLEIIIIYKTYIWHFSDHRILKAFISITSLSSTHHPKFVLWSYIKWTLLTFFLLPD